MDTIFKTEKERVHTVNSDDSEFKTVVETRRVSTGHASHFIRTLDDLNEKMANSVFSLRKCHGNTTTGSTVKDIPSCKSTVLPAQQKDIGKANSQDSKIAIREHSLEESVVATESEGGFSKKPMLVELHTYPGYKEETQTPLPCALTGIAIATIVMTAQSDLCKKPTFKKQLLQLFTLENMQMIIHDVFWWFFCHKYQATAADQEKLFDRIARNYTMLLFNHMENKHKDAMMKRMPDLLSQAVYCIFCQSFPTSYRQFDEEFKNQLMSTIFIWMVGIQPAPRSWSKWNFDKLEPANMRRNEKLQEDANNAAMRSNIQRQRPQSNKDSSSCNNKPKPSNSTVLHSNDINEDRGSHVDFSKSESDHRIPNKTNVNRNEAGSSQALTESSQPQKKKAESCPANAGPKFQRVVFDTLGRSPLVEHYMQQKNLAVDAGTAVFMQRTEIQSLPPLSSITYHDVINESIKESRTIDKNIKRIQQSSAAEHTRLMNRKVKSEKEFASKSAALLSNTAEVKKISDLLRMDSTKDDPEDVDLRGQQLAAAVSNALQMSSQGETDYGRKKR